MPAWKGVPRIGSSSIVRLLVRALEYRYTALVQCQDLERLICPRDRVTSSDARRSELDRQYAGRRGPAERAPCAVVPGDESRARWTLASSRSSRWLQLSSGYSSSWRGPRAPNPVFPYDVHRSREDPARYLVYERHADEHAFQRHVDSERFRALDLEDGIPRLAGRTRGVLHSPRPKRYTSPTPTSGRRCAGRGIRSPMAPTSKRSSRPRTTALSQRP